MTGTLKLYHPFLRLMAKAQEIHWHSPSQPLCSCEKITFGMSDIIYHSIRLHSSQVWAGNRTRDLIYSLQKLRDGPLSGSIFLNKRPSTCIWCQIECKSSQSTLGGKGAHLFFHQGYAYRSTCFGKKVRMHEYSQWSHSKLTALYLSIQMNGLATLKAVRSTIFTLFPPAGHVWRDQKR